MATQRSDEPAGGTGDAIQLHATTVARDGIAALLRGRSGAGKSDLALRFVSARLDFPPTTAGMHALVADDQTIVRRTGDILAVTCPAAIKGRMEVRGLGIVDCPTIAEARLALVVDLVAHDQVDRLPESQQETILGVAVDRLLLAPFEASAPVKLALALDRLRSRCTAKP